MDYPFPYPCGPSGLPWLIKRFVDSEAEFIFVPKSRVMEAAAREKAIPFDSPGAELNHRDDGCIFNAIIEDYGLSGPGLLRLAEIVRAADTDNLESEPLAAGLEAIAVGYSLRFPDDHQNLKAQFAVYDALYAWCRLQVAGD